MHNTYFKRSPLSSFLQRNVCRLLKGSLLICLFISCKKDKEDPGTASLTIVNAVADSRPLVLNFSAEGPILYKTAGFQGISYSDFKQFNSFNGMHRVRLFQYPDTTDKDQPLFDLNLDLPISSVNTLFLTGTTSAPESIFLQEQIPYFEAGDSTMAVRFINLSPGSRPISVNLKDLANGSEVGNLAYKQMSGFQHYPVKWNLPDYVFEFRDAIAGDLIFSYPTNNLLSPNLNPWLYRSMTMVFEGLPGGTGVQAPSVTLVQHFRIF